MKKITSKKMKTIRFFLTVFFLLVICSLSALCQTNVILNNQRIIIEWQNSQPKGTIEVSNGQLLKIEIVKGKGKIKDNSIEFNSNDNVCIIVTLNEVKNNTGSGATIVSVKTNQNPFSFFLRDVNKDYPIYIPEYNVIMTVPEDLRSYSQIESEIKKRNLKSKLQQIENEPEESFESAAKHTRNQPCPTWLGLSRDMRIFELMDNRTNPASEMNCIKPHNSSSTVNLPELDNRSVEFGYMIGRGQGVEISTSRYLEDGVLPILHSTLIDEDIEYRSTAFVSLEKSPLTDKTLIGTDFLVADKFSGGNMFTKEQEELVKPRMEEEQNKTEETVLYYSTEATNNSSVPRYAWFKTIRPGSGWWMKIDYSFSNKNGFSSFCSLIILIALSVKASVV